MTTRKRKIKEGVDTIVTNYKPEKVYLFGSFAWGEPTEDSDVDILIIKRTEKDRIKRQLEVRRLIKGKLPVDILVYTPKEVEERLEMRDFFIEDIVSKGKLLYA